MRQIRHPGRQLELHASQKLTIASYALFYSLAVKKRQEFFLKVPQQYSAISTGSATTPTLAPPILDVASGDPLIIVKYIMEISIPQTSSTTFSTDTLTTKAPIRRMTKTASSDLKLQTQRSLRLR
ncbi:hypothetical protein BGT96224_Ac30076 [Blumeria graminis f. sp. tritici 96224]|uniref:Uncharacterized protein n=1 Tax=Blumeria graminis f. sp. tritici 96224 TaxID=1268274 RepID=A0A656KHT0_BLUGR|nr:hypothetical protein BGT96224_Ac30076 [Blumeria graminis f. sp. tritici 96224]